MSHLVLFFSDLAVVLLAIAAVLAFRYRRQAGARFYLAQLFAWILWASSTALAMAAPDTAIAVFWFYGVRFVGIALAPPLLLLFLLRYTGAWSRPARWPSVTAILAIPVVTALLAISPWRSMLVLGGELELVDDYYEAGEFHPGEWFFVHEAFSYACIAAALALLLRGCFRGGRVLRQQFIMLGIATLLVTGASLLAIYGPDSVQHHDLVMIPAPLSAGLVLWCLRRRHLLDVIPSERTGVLEALRDPVFVVDDQQRLVDANGSALALVAVRADRSRPIGRPFVEVAAATPIGAVLAGSRAADEAAELSCRIGEREHAFDLSVSSAQIGGGGIGRIYTLRDVTESVRMRRDLNAYAHTVAHDLRGPLTVIIGRLELEQSAVDTPASDHVDAALDCARQMADIVRELLLLAKGGADPQAGPGSERLDMAAILGRVLQSMPRMTADVRARLQQPDAWPPARAHGPWVERIWYNLLGNALQYGGTLPLRLGWDRTASGQLRFWVRDRGPGVPESRRESIFASHVRLHDDEQEGYGLGLAIVRRMCDHMHGSCGVTDNDDGVGSCFWFSLPAD